jgi:hypothetical protein
MPMITVLTFVEAGVIVKKNEKKCASDTLVCVCVHLHVCVCMSMCMYVLTFVEAGVIGKK